MGKVLAILGSPHKEGITAAMLNCAADAAQQAGWQVEKVFLYEKQIAFCKGCRRCMETKNCVQKDDMVEITQQIRQCDRVILAAPTYWANVPAAVKNLFDRLLGAAMEETNTFPKPRFSSDQQYLLLTACNTIFPFSRLCGQSTGTVRAMNEFFKTSGMRHLGTVTADGAKNQKGISLRLQKKIRRYWN
jgi:multimeric flavodoxin WrbA